MQAGPHSVPHCIWQRALCDFRGSCHLGSGPSLPHPNFPRGASLTLQGLSQGPGVGSQGDVGEPGRRGGRLPARQGGNQASVASWRRFQEKAVAARADAAEGAAW